MVYENVKEVDGLDVFKEGFDFWEVVIKRYVLYICVCLCLFVVCIFLNFKKKICMKLERFGY